MATDSNKFLGEGLTYDDVLLVPAYSEVMPRDVNVSTQFTKKSGLMFLLFLQQWIRLQRQLWQLPWRRKAV